MAYPVVITNKEKTQEIGVLNYSINFWGSSINHGWEIVERGFWYYKTSSGVETEQYVKSTSSHDKTEFVAHQDGLTPYTSYTFRASGYFQLNPETYIEIFGDWEEVKTDARAEVRTVIGIEATKFESNNSIKFIAYLVDNAGGHVGKRGFKYGLSETDTWDVSEIAGGQEPYELVATGIPGNSYIYFRAYVVTPTGTYYGEYERVSTKVAIPKIYMMVQATWYDLRFFLTAYDEDGNIYNAWVVQGEYWPPNSICADNKGYVYTIKDKNTIIKRKDGAVVTTRACTGIGYSIAFNPVNNRIYVRGRFDDWQYLKGYDTDLNPVTSGEIMYHSTDNYAYTGFAIDSEGFYYTINYLTKKLEKWEWVEEKILQDTEFGPEAVDIDNDIITLDIDILTGDMVKFYANDTLPEPLIEDTVYWAIRISGNHIKVAMSHEDAMAGISIDLTTQGTGVMYIDHLISSYVWEKTERDLSDVYVGRVNYLAIAGKLIYSNESGEQGWTIPTSLDEPPTEWSPSNIYKVRTLSARDNIFIMAGINTESKFVLTQYKETKEFISIGMLFSELDYYSIAGVGTYVNLSTISAERSSVYANVKLIGEIIVGGGDLSKVGFEYIIQDEQPSEESSGTEVLIEEETKGEGFANEEYSIYTGNELRVLYNLDNDKEDWEETTIWWFRAIGYDDNDTKYYGEWMKNVPTVITGDMNNLLVLNAIPIVEAHGNLVDKGANIVTKRGFRIIKEYKGDLFCADFYIGIAFGNFKVMEELESHTVLGGPDGYTVVDYYWTGRFYRDSVEDGNFDLGEFIRELGGGMGFEGFGIYLKQNDTYLIQAIAYNDLGWGFGEQKLITTLGGEGDGTGKIDVDVTDNKLDSTKFEKTVTLGTVPTGCRVTRIGIRLGRTKGCNELHYYEDGSWGSGESVTFMVELEPNSTYYIMPYIVMNYGNYEEEILGMLGYTDPDNEEEYLSKYPVEIVGELEEEITTSAQAGEGNYSYRSINQEITCEKIGHQGLIDYYGRRRAYTVNNHLIQKKDVCCLVISNYLDNFQRLKLKVAIDIDMPIPFQEQDTILLGDGKVLFKADTQGIVLFKNDGQGELKQQSFILAKIRKLGATYVSGGSTIIPMELEV